MPDHKPDQEPDQQPDGQPAGGEDLYVTDADSLRAAIDGQLTLLARDAFDDDDLILTPTLTAPEVPGWDSFNHIAFIVAIEEEFGVSFQPTELEEMRNVGDLASNILQKLTTPGL